MTPLSRIRNFAIIAHIDHGKSTLADRLIQSCGAVAERDMKEQMLDSMDIERERGITIKAQTVRLTYTAKDGETYQLNLMDTPGHVDFAYEVSRSLAACEGSILVVDASQGVEAQTLANVYQAIDAGHEIVPVLNKIDLPAAEPERIRQQIEDVIGLDASNAVLISAKTGLGIPDVLEAIVTRLPPPKGDAAAPLKALLVDSWYDAYLGVVVLVRVIDGVIRKNQKVRFMATGAARDIDHVGIFTPKKIDLGELGPGEIGFITAGIKQISDTKVGDTITDEKNPADKPLAGFKPSVPVVFCGLFPTDAAEFEYLRESLGKLALNDASFQFEPESSAALGFGFRCGFLGLLHLEIVQERLEREFNLDLITTAPSVVYKIYLTNGTIKELHNPGRYARSGAYREDRGAVDQGDDLHARRISRRHSGALQRPARRAGGAHLCRQPRDAGLPLAAQRGGVRFLRPAQIDQPGLCELRLSRRRLPRRRSGEHVDPRERRAGRCARHDRAPGQRRKARAPAVRAAEGIDSQAAVQDCDSGGHRRPHHRARNHLGPAQGRDGQMLRRRHSAANANCSTSRKKGKKRMRQFGEVEIPQSAFIAALKMDDR